MVHCLSNCAGTAAALSAYDVVPHLDFSPTNEPSAGMMKVPVKGLKVLVPGPSTATITGNLAHQFDQCAVGKFPKLFQSIFDDRARFRDSCAKPAFPGDTLNQPQALHAGMSVLADDDVIMHGDAERTGDVD